MEDARKSVERLFGEAEDGVISLDILDKVADNYISLDMLDKPMKKEKCRHLSPLMNCNVGGSGHAGCADENFHSHCKLRMLADKIASRQKLI